MPTDQISSTVQACPYFSKQYGQNFRCEGGKLVFPTRKAKAEFMHRLCNSLSGCNDCKLKQMLDSHYDSLYSYGRKE